MKKEEIEQRLIENKQERKQLKQQLKDLPSLEVGRWYKTGISFMFLNVDNPQDKQKVGYGIRWDW